jgi:RNA polymerase sigma factor (sigma-70 family)
MSGSVGFALCRARGHHTPGGMHRGTGCVVFPGVRYDSNVETPQTKRSRSIRATIPAAGLDGALGTRDIYMTAVSPRIGRSSQQISRALAASLYAQAGAARWGLAIEQFTERLRDSAARHLGDLSAAPAEIERYLTTLRLEDLALAAACAAGLDAAWEYFVANYREQLYAAARAIVGTPRDAERARELADSLYADLYGLPGAGGARRKPLFAYFHGRSKLSTWLRAVLSQRYVDSLRAGRRQVALDDVGEFSESNAVDERVGGTRSPAHAASTRAPEARDPDREKYLDLLHSALAEALARVSAEDRSRLRAYYLDSLTLAEIAKQRGEHEATASRHLERCRRELRTYVERRLLDGAPQVDGGATRPALSAAQVALCFEYAVEDWPFDLKSELDRGSGDEPGIP